MIKLDSGKLNIVIDGQFGSTGKGLLSNYIAINNHIDFSISNSGPNAGHTFYHNIGNNRNDKKLIVKHLPVSGLINKHNTIYLCAGALINPEILIEEIENFSLDDNRLFIHPRASIIENVDLVEESLNDGVKQIASTMSGVGSSLIRKIKRNSNLADKNELLSKYISEINLHKYLVDNCTALIELPQGMDLSLNHGLSYPYCTSRDITIGQALNDANVHPKFLGKVCVSIRTFPIRVGNIIENNKIIGYSGPFWSDSIELSWEDIGVEKEYTTRTNRVRRIATFSMNQYHKMLDIYHPDYILLNFCNYLSHKDLTNLLNKLPEVTHLGFGPRQQDIKER